MDLRHALTVTILTRRCACHRAPVGPGIAAGGDFVSLPR